MLQPQPNAEAHRDPAEGAKNEPAAHSLPPLARQSPPRNVVCVHGLTRNGRDFDMVATRLVKAGAYRVFCIDLIGRGRSDYLQPESTATYDYPLYVFHLKQFLVHQRVGIAAGPARC